MWVSSAGLVCAVGVNARSACTAMRAGIASASETHYLSNDNSPVVGARVDLLPADMPRRDRLVAMLCRAVVDCVIGARDLDPDRTPLLVVLPRSDQPGACRELEGAGVADALRSVLGWTFEPTRSRVFPLGAVGTAHALREAIRVAHETRGDGVLICGVDSLLCAPTLLWLEQTARLRTKRNADGIVPGEAAGCVWLTRKQRAPHSPRVLSAGFATERATVLDDQPFRAEGMVSAAGGALEAAGLTMADIQFRISDAGGESYDFREQSLLVGRLLRQRKEAFPLWHPAELIGSTGAASGLVHLAMIEDALRGDYAPGARVLSCCSEPTGERSAVVLEGAGSPREPDLAPTKVAL